jgi:acetoin utilization protein AcuB
MEDLMRVADIMETRVEAADASTSAEAAWLHMRRRGLRLYVVMDADGTIGVVTREQLGGRGGALNRFDRVLRDFVKSGAIVTTSETPLRELARTLEPRVEGCLPVVHGGRLVGVLTLSHLLDVIGRLERVHRPAPRRTRRATKQCEGAVPSGA